MVAKLQHSACSAIQRYKNVAAVPMQPFTLRILTTYKTKQIKNIAVNISCPRYFQLYAEHHWHKKKSHIFLTITLKTAKGKNTHTNFKAKNTLNDPKEW